MVVFVPIIRWRAAKRVQHSADVFSYATLLSFIGQLKAWRSLLRSYFDSELKTFPLNYYYHWRTPIWMDNTGWACDLRMVAKIQKLKKYPVSRFNPVILFGISHQRARRVHCYFINGSLSPRQPFQVQFTPKLSMDTNCTWWPSSVQMYTYNLYICPAADPTHFWDMRWV